MPRGKMKDYGKTSNRSAGGRQAKAFSGIRGPAPNPFTKVLGSRVLAEKKEEREGKFGNR